MSATIPVQRNVNIGTALKTTNMLGYVNATGAASFNVAPAGPLTLNVSSASQPILIGTDANAGTITLGSSSKTLAINANTTISGNLTVNGTMETFNATTTTFTDNVIALHCMPASTADSCAPVPTIRRWRGDWEWDFVLYYGYVDASLINDHDVF